MDKTTEAKLICYPPLVFPCGLQESVGIPSIIYFGEHKRLHLESSKQSYYIISLRAIIKAIFTSRYQTQGTKTKGTKKKDEGKRKRGGNPCSLTGK